MKVFIPVIAASALLASTVSGWSGSASGNLQVKITIKPECKLTATSDTTLDFGSHSLVTDNVTRDATIKVLCTKGTDYSIALGNGENGANAMGRKMKRVGSGAGKEDYIPYQLYMDEARELVWGNTPASKSSDPNKSMAEMKDIYTLTNAGDCVKATGTGFEQPFTAYGRVGVPKASQTPVTAALTPAAPAGEYTDTVTVTVAF